MLARTLAVVSALAALLAMPTAALAANPGPPNVEVVPPEVIVDDRGDMVVTFDPGLILFSYPDGSQRSCVIDPALPPNPCAELASAPGPPNVEVVPPEAILGEDGAAVGFVPGLVSIVFADGTALSCVIDPALPPSPCAEPTR